MLRSLYSGVSGMRSLQTKMDVIANNVANVNTTAFKSGRARFQDMLSQTSSNAQSPMADTAAGAAGGGGTFNLGGINAQQVGLGVKVGSIDNIMTGGSLQPTNRALDFAIENEGFFVVKENEMSESVYTRDGGFYTDHEGSLVNANGFRVMGYSYANLDKDGSFIKDSTITSNIADADLKQMEIFKHVGLGPIDDTNIGANPDVIEVPEADQDDLVEGDPGVYTLQDFTIDGTGLIKGVYSGRQTATDDIEVRHVNIGKLAMANFNNPEGLEKIGNNNYVRSNNSGDAELGQAGTAGYGAIRQGFLEMSNVDLANEFTEMIVASRAYQANSRSITTSDEMIQELINLKR